jgi:hypothetical protein
MPRLLHYVSNLFIEILLALSVSLYLDLPRVTSAAKRFYGLERGEGKDAATCGVFESK